VSDDSGDLPKPVVGYRNPPAAHRFKKGVSGNPKGRPKKTKASADPGVLADNRLSHVIMHEAYRPVQVMENGRLEKLPMIQAVIRSLGVSAVKGSHRAQLALAALVRAIEQNDLNDKRALFETIVEYKRGWQETFEICDARGEPRPDPVPHPDDLEFNARTGEVCFNGPFDDGEKAQWDQGRQRLRYAEDEIAWLREWAEREPEHRQKREEEIAQEQYLIDLISLAYPDEKTRRVPGFNIHEWRDRERKHQLRRAELRKLAKP
jgi:hypothetical protein